MDISDPPGPPRGRLQGKVAVVCGAGSSAPGLSNGMACAVVFAREGARVFAVDVDAERMQATRARIEADGGECVLHRCDASAADEVNAMVQACLDALGGRIDVLVNNVGINAVGGPCEIDEETFDRVLRVNVKSTWLTCRAVLPVMQAQRAGAIVNVSSLASIRYSYPSVAYAASKGAVNQLTRNIAGQYARDGIRCNAILPGYIASAGSLDRLRRQSDDDGERVRAERARAVPSQRLGEPWDVAFAALYLAGDESRYVTGIELAVDGGLSIATP